eukprot:1156215-Pelagomonas_calceolata.AAC.1
MAQSNASSLPGPLWGGMPAAYHMVWAGGRRRRRSGFGMIQGCAAPANHHFIFRGLRGGLAGHMAVESRRGLQGVTREKRPQSR